jgi:hypothetical protein
MINKRIIKTKLPLAQLTDSHLQRIRTLYDSAGLPRDERFLGEHQDANFIKNQIELCGVAELRPLIAYEPAGKFYFRGWLDTTDDKKYIRIDCGVRCHPTEDDFNLEGAISTFYDSVKAEF